MSAQVAMPWERTARVQLETMVDERTQQAKYLRSQGEWMIRDGERVGNDLLVGYGRDNLKEAEKLEKAIASHVAHLGASEAA